MLKSFVAPLVLSLLSTVTAQDVCQASPYNSLACLTTVAAASSACDGATFTSTVTAAAPALAAQTVNDDLASPEITSTRVTTVTVTVLAIHRCRCQSVQG